jgi:hypothetical protein
VKYRGIGANDNQTMFCSVSAKERPNEDWKLKNPSSRIIMAQKTNANAKNFIVHFNFVHFF